MTFLTIRASDKHRPKVERMFKSVLQKLRDYGVIVSVETDNTEVVPVMFFESQKYHGSATIRAILSKTEKELRPKVTGKRVPNRARTVEGKWYKFAGEFKIEETKRPYYKDGTKVYRVTVRGFPDKHRTGMIPAEIVLESTDEKTRQKCSSSYFYDVSENDVREDIFGLIQQIRTSTFEMEEKARELESKLTPRGGV